MRPRRRWFLAGVLAAGVAAAGGGLLLAAAGVIPVAASSGHWRWAAWFLHFTMQRSVATYAREVAPATLTDPAMIQLGAAHFGNACAPCHGGIDSQPLLPQKMTPPAPRLAALIGQWQPSELHWIVKHGIRYSAMPAWPTEARDDDIWPVVAFLLAMPTMSEAAYRALAYGLDTGPQLQDLGVPAVAGCSHCHGMNIRTTSATGLAAVPALGCQSPEYLAGSLRAYAGGDRHSGIMQAVAAELTDAQIDGLATAYGSSAVACASRNSVRKAGDGAAAARSSDQVSIERGALIASEGIAARGVPACVSCHDGSARPEFPVLESQPYDYLRRQLQLFRSGQRGGTPYAPLMALVASRLDGTDIDDLARHYAARRVTMVVSDVADPPARP